MRHKMNTIDDAELERRMKEWANRFKSQRTELLGLLNYPVGSTPYVCCYYKTWLVSPTNPWHSGRMSCKTWLVSPINPWYLGRVSCKTLLVSRLTHGTRGDATSVLHLHLCPVSIPKMNGQRTTAEIESETSIEKKFPIRACPPLATNPTEDATFFNKGRKRKWAVVAHSLLENIKQSRHQPLNLDDNIITEIVLGTTISKRVLLNSTVDPILATTLYAQIACNSQAKAKDASCLDSFQVLILNSACAVLEHCRCPMNEIDNVMNIRRQSTPKNLKRLRAGAVWASNVISKTAGGHWNGLSDRIVELYFHCEWPPLLELKPKLTRKRQCQDVDLWVFIWCEEYDDTVFCRAAEKPWAIWRKFAKDMVYSRIR